MSTEENHPSLYSALYEALSDHRLIGKLLQHPEFRHEAGKICRDIAGPAGGEDLLQTACRRVLEHAGQLDPDSIPSEGKFFSWFTQLARHVHLSHMLAAAAVNSCTDGAGRWADDPADVPPDDVGRFLSHADACPYHTRILRADEESLRATFSRGRGLDSQGRILLGDELNASVAEHRRRLRRWREDASRKGEPFGHVSLYNDGREVASCGKFFDFSIHKSRNKLDPRAGLQIYGVSSSHPDEKVLLGVYALEGVRHEGKELTFELDNGYTVGLRVKEQDETTFDIHFWCVKTETTEAKLLGAEGGTDVVQLETPEEEDFEGSPVYPVPPVPPPPVGSVKPSPTRWWPQLQSPHAVAYLAISCIVALPCLLVGWSCGRTGALVKYTGGGHASPAEARVEPPGQVPNADHQPTAQVEAQQTPNAQLQIIGETGKAPQTQTGVGPETRSTAPLASVARSTQESGRGATTRPEAQSSRGTGHGMPGDEGKLIFAATTLRGPGHKIARIRLLDEVSTIRLLVFDGREYSNGNNSALHIMTDPTLGKKLDDALQAERLLVERVGEQSLATASYQVRWDVSTDAKASEKSYVVTLNASILKGSENFSHKAHSYEGVGSSWDAAYDAAVKKAVRPVVEEIRREDERGLSASATVTEGPVQLGGAPPEEQSTSENKVGDGTGTDRSESSMPERAKDGCNIE